MGRVAFEDRIDPDAPEFGRHINSSPRGPASHSALRGHTDNVTNKYDPDPGSTNATSPTNASAPTNSSGLTDNVGRHRRTSKHSSTDVSTNASGQPESDKVNDVFKSTNASGQPKSDKVTKKFDLSPGSNNNASGPTGIVPKKVRMQDREIVYSVV